LARAKANKEYNTFIGGLITEASPLTFPENASIDEDNFILERNGARRRRLGLDYEQNFSLEDSGVLSTTASGLALSASEWKGINDDPTLGLVVVQQGLDLYFYDLFAESISASQKNLGDVGNPTGVLTLEAGSATNNVSITQTLGRLVVVNGSKFIFSLVYDNIGDVVILEKQIINIRDLFGVDDALAVDERPSILTQAHSYNLQNQGWDNARITEFFASQGVYPSNADIWFLGKDGTDTFDPDQLVKQFFGSTPAPKGHNIIDAFNRGSGRVDASDTTVTVTQPTPKTGDTIIGGGGGLKGDGSFSEIP